MVEHCAEVETGEGRVASCLEQAALEGCISLRLVGSPVILLDGAVVDDLVKPVLDTRTCRIAAVAKSDALEPTDSLASAVPPLLFPFCIRRLAGCVLSSTG